MKTPFLALSLWGLFLLSAQAEPIFYDFGKLTSAEQQAFGYTVNANKEQTYLSVKISSKAATACKGARLYIRDDRKQTLAEINTGLTHSADGSLSISISREALRGTVELIIYSSSIKDAPMFENFGGFIFSLSSPQQ